MRRFFIWTYPGVKFPSIFFTLLLLTSVLFLQTISSLVVRYLVYFPVDEVVNNPSKVGLHYEDIYFTNSEGFELHGWYLPGDTGVTLLWFHGNAGNISDRLNLIKQIRTQVEVGILIFDYRGYGLSEGVPSESGLYLDAKAAMDYLTDRLDADYESQNIVFFGRSLGSAVALRMATIYDTQAVIVEAPFTSLEDMAKIHYSYAPDFLINWLIQGRYDSRETVKDLTSPLMVIHGQKDPIVPISMGRKIYDSAKVEKYFYFVEGAGHNDTFVVAGSEYFGRIRDFIESKSKTSHFE